MPITYSIDQVSGLVISVATGVVDLKTYETCLRQRNEDPRYSAKLNGLFDARHASFEFSRDEIKQWVKVAGSEKSRSTARRAIVARGDLEPGLSRLYEALASMNGVKAKVFRQYDDALRWLSDG